LQLATKHVAAIVAALMHWLVNGCKYIGSLGAFMGCSLRSDVASLLSGHAVQTPSLFHAFITFVSIASHRFVLHYSGLQFDFLFPRTYTLVPSWHVETEQLSSQHFFVPQVHFCVCMHKHMTSLEDSTT
jgi:hypothetical protein